MRKPFFSLLILGALTVATLAVVPTGTPEPEEPKIATASDEAANQISAFKIPEDFSTQLFAAEPLLANPVAFTVDNQGRVWVCESFRQNRGVTDNRQHDQPGLKETSQLLLSKTESTITKNCLAKKLAITRDMTTKSDYWKIPMAMIWLTSQPSTLSISIKSKTGRLQESSSETIKSS